MLKRMLLLLGETRSAQAARQFAFRLSKNSGAELAGLAGIDLTAIEAPMPGGAGASAYKADMESKLKKSASDMRLRLHDAFAGECKEQGVPFDWLSFEGDPADVLQQAIETRDLAVAGYDADFSGDARPEPSVMLSRLVQTAPRPVIVCPDELPQGSDVLVAYDGSIASMRAIQLFALLGLADKARVAIVSVDESQELAARRAAAAATFLRSHGYDAEPIGVATKAEPSDVLAIEVESRKIGMLVMGAYGHRGWREFIFGSTTTALIDDPPCVIFVYH